MRCEICGENYGGCNTDIHLIRIKQNDPKYGFDLDSPVETEYFDLSVSPRLSEPYTNSHGKRVALVASVTFSS